MNRLLKISTVLLGVVTLALSSTTAFAEHGSSGSDGSTSSNTTKAAQTEDHKAASAAAKEKEQEKIKEAKDNVCKAKKDGAGNVENRVVNRGQKRLDAYSKIAERAEKFKVDKGLSVPNYDALVADVNAKKAAAQAAVDTLTADKAQIPTVTCGNGNGKPAVEKFKTDLKAEQNALKAYKASIKTLIQAIKTAAKAATADGSQQ